MKNLWIIGFILFFGCNEKPNNVDIEKGLVETLSKYGPITISGFRQSDYFKQVRSVLINNKMIELQFLSSPENKGVEPADLIVLYNNERDYYIIPYFSNKYRDFWKFKNDTLSSFVLPKHLTFENEIQMAFEKLRFNDSIKTIVLNEIFTSLLHCEKITVRDSSEILTGNYTYNNELKEETYDNCRLRYRENFIDLFKKGSDIQGKRKEFYFDRIEKRIYSYCLNSSNKRIEANFKLNTYRQDCVCKLMTE